MAATQVRELKLRITAEDAASSVLSRVDGNVAKLGRGANGRGGGFLKDLKSQAGEESSAGMFFKTLRGAGALAGAGLAANEVAQLAAAGRNAADALRDAKKSAGEITDDLLKQVPILGRLYSAGRDIREIFTAEEYSAKRITIEVERQNVAFDEQRNAIKRAAAAHQQWQKEIANPSGGDLRGRAAAEDAASKGALAEKRRKLNTEIGNLQAKMPEEPDWIDRNIMRPISSRTDATQRAQAQAEIANRQGEIKIAERQAASEAKQRAKDLAAAIEATQDESQRRQFVKEQERVAAERQYNSEIKSERAELYANTLRSAGKALEADKLLIADRRRVALEGARSTDERALAEIRAMQDTSAAERKQREQDQQDRQRGAEDKKQQAEERERQGLQAAEMKADRVEQFRATMASGFGGESRLLTGVVGAGTTNAVQSQTKVLGDKLDRLNNLLEDGAVRLVTIS